MNDQALRSIGTSQEELARELIRVQGELEALKTAENVLKTMLRADGPRSFTVDEHRVTITAESQGLKQVVNWEAIAKGMKPSPQRIAANTKDKVTKTSSSVRVFGPKTSK